VVQVKKLVQKMVTRDTLSYRKMTDRPQVKDMMEKDVTADVEMKEAAPAQEEKAEVDEKTLAQGEGTVYVFPITMQGVLFLMQCVPASQRDISIDCGVISLR